MTVFFYMAAPQIPLNDLGLPAKDYYTTADLCKVLNIKPDTLRHRLRNGRYPESLKVGGKRRFTEIEIQDILETTKVLIRKGIFASGKH